MKFPIITITLLAFILSFGNGIDAQTRQQPTNSTITSVRLHNLRAKSNKLQNEIRVQDAKRNQQVAGVSPESMEIINERQDSICLALRSELVDVMLEMKEIAPDKHNQPLLEQLNQIRQNVSRSVVE